jgi:hypothetical protein
MPPVSRYSGQSPEFQYSPAANFSPDKRKSPAISAGDRQL